MNAGGISKASEWKWGLGLTFFAKISRETEKVSLKISIIHSDRYSNIIILQE